MPDPISIPAKKVEKEAVKIALASEDGSCFNQVKICLTIATGDTPSMFMALPEGTAASKPEGIKNGVRLTFERPLSNIAVGADIFDGSHVLVAVTRKSLNLQRGMKEKLTFVFVPRKKAVLKGAHEPKFLMLAEKWLEDNANLAFDICHLYRNTREGNFVEIVVDLQGCTGRNNPRTTFQFKACKEDCCD